MKGSVRKALKVEGKSSSLEVMERMEAVLEGMAVGSLLRLRI